MLGEADFEIGYNVPAVIGMDEADIQTPCLIIDLDAFEENVATMRDRCSELDIKLRAHGKMHKSADVARYQIEHGGAVGVCAQKVAEAEAFVRSGIEDVLVTNQVRDPFKIDRLARLAGQAKVSVCVDDLDNIADLSAAAQKHGTTIGVIVEIDCGAGRCGVEPGGAVVPIAQAAAEAPGLEFLGLQAYHGSSQHLRDYADRQATIDTVITMVRDCIAALKQSGLECAVVTGAGTGSYAFEGSSGVYNEIQCGSYAFMDADYQRIHDEHGKPITEFRNALFILTSIMSHVKADRAICDAGLKAQSVDSGLPVVFGRDDVEYLKCSDEHGVIADPQGALKINQRLRLIPGHCDPTCNIHDWFVGVRNGRVECLWPVTARGKGF